MAYQLSRSASPAFEYFLTSLCNQHPSSSLFPNLLIRRHELFACISILLERHYLKHYESSFCENFYGLRRSVDPKNALPTSRKFSSLVELVLVPYLCSKSKRFTQISNLVSLVFSLSYLFQRTIYYSPFLWLQGITLQRLTSSDMRRMEPTTTDEYGGLSFALGKIGLLLRFVVVSSAVTYKIVQFYYSEENRQQRERVSSPPQAPLPPLRPLPVKPQSLGLELRMCSLCGQGMREPAVSSSGCCFCYSCLVSYVRSRGECPVTGQACEEGDIRKIYMV